MKLKAVHRERSALLASIALVLLAIQQYVTQSEAHITYIEVKLPLKVSIV